MISSTMKISDKQSKPSNSKKDRRRSVRNSWQHLFERWIIYRIPPARNVTLNHHNIFILPNKQGMGFCLILLLMFIGAINYEIRLAFALVFLLLGMLILSILYTYRNLSGLEVSAKPENSVFAGEKAEVSITLTAHLKRVYESVQVSFKQSGRLTANLIDVPEQRLSLFVETYQRGRFSPGRLTIETLFPFGVCRSWSLLNLNFECLVYPKPIACQIDFLNSDAENEGVNNIITGNDDFYGLREYQKGDSLQHVAWKSLARGQGMMTKQYSSNVDDDIWLKWDMFPDYDVEGRLSRLCYCVLQLDASGLDYGLSLPDKKIDPGRGSAHYNQIMEALALYDLDDSRSKEAI